MKKKFRRPTIEIAVAGISAGLMLLFLYLAVIVRVGSISLFVAASVVLMVPISKKYYVAAVFAYVASSLLAFAIVGDILQVLGFIIYFGPMTIASCVMAEKKVKPYITFPVKIVYINATLAILYFATNTLVVDLSSLGINLHYAVIAVVGTVLLLLLDTLMLMLYVRLKPLMDKVIKDSSSKGKKKEEDDVFEDFKSGEYGKSDTAADGKDRIPEQSGITLDVLDETATDETATDGTATDGTATGETATDGTAVSETDDGNRSEDNNVGADVESDGLNGSDIDDSAGDGEDGKELSASDGEKAGCEKTSKSEKRKHARGKREKF